MFPQILRNFLSTTLERIITLLQMEVKLLDVSMWPIQNAKLYLNYERGKLIENWWKIVFERTT